MFAALLILMSVTPNCCALCGGQDALISLIRQGALTQSQTKHILWPPVTLFLPFILAF